MFKKKLVKVLSILLCMCILISTLIGCDSKEPVKDFSFPTNDTYIIFTGDVHCADDENIGYAGVKAYKDFLKTKTNNVCLVDLGDAIQGDYAGASTKGDYIIDIMNKVGYDLAILGNHEFDYGMDNLSTLIAKSNAEYLGCNISYTGSNENALKDLLPYQIKKFDSMCVGFVGVTTPYSVVSSAPTNFMENGEFVYDFCGSQDGQILFDKVQQSVNECKQKGAEKIVLLAHLGDTEADTPYDSRNLIASTYGVDVVLDGHSHSVVPCDILKNKNGENVLLSSTGTGIRNIGMLTITASGNISVGIVSNFLNKDKEIEKEINKFNQAQEELLNEVITKSDFELSVNQSGVRVVRTRETAIGNLVADAFRISAKSDIAIINGGGVRDSLPKGNITYGDVRKVMPFQNAICSVKATGQEIADALELGYSVVQKEYTDGEKAVGELGGFLQISGLKCKVDTSVQSSVKTDENGMFVSVDGARRVSDIQVLQTDGSYSPLEMDKTYTVASYNYLLAKNGDGYSMFADNEFVITEGIIDNQVLIDYIKSMGDSISENYRQTEGRITIE